MTLTDLEIMQKYLPYIYYDKNEPFYPKDVGCSIFYETMNSASFNRIIEIKGDTQFAIEYAIYWDFDIEHLYELEHVWIYVNKNGEVIDAESSFHGRYFRSLLRDRSNIEEVTHIRLYSQPGKHAFLPKIEYFYLIPDLFKVTYDNVGKDGLIVADVLKEHYDTNDAINIMVKEYLQQFKFRPTMEFEKKLIESNLLISWDELKEKIPFYICNKLKEIENKLK